jgi:hypothetical protein
MSGPEGADLASLLAAGERAAFHGPPAAAVPDLERAVVLAQREGRHAEVTAAVWLLGVALSAAGRYGAALRVLGPLLGAGGATAPETRLFASLASSTAASIHRGLGRHEAAQGLDEAGLSLAGGMDEATFDATLGLATDGVGLGDLATARARLAEAEEMVTAHQAEWWRQRVRFDWARAEVALLADDAHAAVAAASAAVERAESARAPRHVAKGLLFRGVAEVQSAVPAATATLRRAATLAEGLQALPVAWQARAVLGAVLAGTADEESTRSLAAARAAVMMMADDLPAELRDGWLATPNVSALLEG